MVCVVFSLKGARYAIDVVNVEEVIPLPAITPVAKLPSFFCGMINLRGHAVPIMDLKNRLGMGVHLHVLSNDIVVIKVDGNITGLIVDKVLAVIEIQEDQRISAPQMNPGIDIQYIAGMAQLDSGLTFLLNIDRILAMTKNAACVDLALHSGEV